MMWHSNAGLPTDVQTDNAYPANKSYEIENKTYESEQISRRCITTEQEDSGLQSMDTMDSGASELLSVTHSIPDDIPSCIDITNIKDDINKCQNDNNLSLDNKPLGLIHSDIGYDTSSDLFLEDLSIKDTYINISNNKDTCVPPKEENSMNHFEQDDEGDK